ncbi:MAG: protein kinase [Planctomycetota bacterium]
MTLHDDFHDDDWLQPPGDGDTRSRKTRSSDTHGAKFRARRHKPPSFPDQTLGPFTIGSQLDVGSHGWIFNARDQSQRDVAVKILTQPESRSGIRAKSGFRRMRSVRHPNLMPVLEMYQTQDYLAYSMVQMAGANLESELKRLRLLPLQEGYQRLCCMVQQAAAALAHLHSHQLIHRDVKPTNLMFDSSANCVRLIDFDLVTDFDADLDLSCYRDYLVWTPGYVAPEVLSRQYYSPAGDIFSLGMVLLVGLRALSRSERRREHNQSDMSDLVDADVTPLRRDSKDSDLDRKLIQHALDGLHPSIPGCLIDTVAEMVSPDLSDRPLAASLADRAWDGSTLNKTTNRSASLTTTTNRFHTQVQKQDAALLDRLHTWMLHVQRGRKSRLHIQGPTRCGKSTLFAIAVDQLRQHRWSQVFESYGDLASPHPWATLEPLLEDIVSRYRRRDREPVAVDDDTREVLVHAFRSLDLILSRPRKQESTTDQIQPSNDEVRSALVTFFRGVRSIGPLFLAIEQIERTDASTLSLLRELIKDDHDEPGLGIITTSTDSFPADETLTMPRIE